MVEPYQKEIYYKRPDENLKNDNFNECNTKPYRSGPTRIELGRFEPRGHGIQTMMECLLFQFIYERKTRENQERGCGSRGSMSPMLHEPPFRSFLCVLWLQHENKPPHGEDGQQADLLICVSISVSTSLSFQDTITLCHPPAKIKRRKLSLVDRICITLGLTRIHRLHTTQYTIIFRLINSRQTILAIHLFI